MFFSAKVEVGGPLAEYGTGAGTGIGDSVAGWRDSGAGY
jgi:hypothetical protein